MFDLSNASPGQAAVVLGFAVIFLGYLSPFVANSFSREKEGKAALAIKMDRMGAWLIVGGFFLAALGFLNLFGILV